MTGTGSGLLFFMLALPTPAAVAAALAGMGLRLRAGGRVCRFRLQEGMGQADIQVDSDGQNNLLHTVTSFNEFTVKYSCKVLLSSCKWHILKVPAERG